MRRRDLAILALSIVSVYFALQQEGSFTFVPVRALRHTPFSALSSPP